MADKTLKSKHQRLSIEKYVAETIGDEGGAGFRVISAPQQVDFEALRLSGWITVEIGLVHIKPKMDIVVLLTCCARGNDSDDKLDTMRDAVRDAFAPGSIFPHYNTDTHEVIGGFMVGETFEGPAIEQPGGGWNVTYTVTLNVGVVV